MVGSGEPADFIAQHSVIAGKNILQGIIENMAHGKDPRNIGRRNNDGIRFLSGNRFPVEKVVFLPEGVPFFFRQGGLIGFGHIFGHFRSPELLLRT
jgi:hypothetical protein